MTKQITPKTQERWTEDLHWQALRSSELGNALCRCEGHYHSIWSVLRAVGAFHGLNSELPLLKSVLAPLLGDDTKLLLAGSADPGLFAAVGKISGSRSPTVTIVDKCQAPLQLIQEFAETKGVSCRTLHMDMLDLDGSEKWERMLLHYTLDFIERSRRKAFFKHLILSLEPEGKLVCVAKTNQRVDPTAQAKFESALIAHAKDAISNSSFKSVLQDDRFEEMIQAYAKAAALRRLRMVTVDELKSLLVSSGFTVMEEHTAQRESGFHGDSDAKQASFSGSVAVAVIIAEAAPHDRRARA